jgi:S-adenosylmethionine hydrolase
MAPVVTLLTDYGYSDEFAGVLHGVIARGCPEARVIDITHGIARHDVSAAAIVLRNALPQMPAGVHVVVVDPGVGGERRAIALKTAEEDRILLGPDNGVLELAAARFGGAVEAFDVSRSPWRLEPVSATFHGRDLFAPIAARLAAGAKLGEAGDPIEPASIQGLGLPEPVFGEGEVVAHALHADRFGNVLLNVTHEQLAGSGLQLGKPVELRIGARRVQAHVASTFTDVEPGAAIVYEDASRSLAVAINRGHAARELGIRMGTEIRIVRS